MRDICRCRLFRAYRVNFGKIISVTVKIKHRGPILTMCYFADQ